MGIKKSCHLSSGNLPALNSGSDQSLSLLVPDYLHQARIPLVHILLQRAFQLLCSPQDNGYTQSKTTHSMPLSLGLQYHLSRVIFLEQHIRENIVQELTLTCNI